MITLLDMVYCSFLIMIHALVSISLKLSLMSDIVFKIIAGAKGSYTFRFCITALACIMACVTFTAPIPLSFLVLYLCSLSSL